MEKLMPCFVIIPCPLPSSVQLWDGDQVSEPLLDDWYPHWKSAPVPWKIASVGDHFTSCYMKLSIYIILHYIYIILHEFTLFYNILHHVTLVYIVLHYFTLFYIILHQFTSFYISLHMFTLFYIMLHYLAMLTMQDQKFFHVSIVSFDRPRSLSRWSRACVGARSWSRPIISGPPN